MRQPTVLVVEDDPGLNQLVGLLLRSEGHAVISVASGEEALAVLGECGRIQLLLTDFNLGSGMNGLELASRVQRDNAAVKVLLMSGTPECEGLAHDRGWPFLQKPFTPASLLEQVRHLAAEPLAGRRPALVEERVTRSRRVTGEGESGASRQRLPQSPGTAPRRKRPGRAGECREGRGRSPAGRRRSGHRGGAAA
jgi:CheY-like chemotaxis protein